MYVRVGNLGRSAIVLRTTRWCSPGLAAACEQRVGPTRGWAARDVGCQRLMRALCLEDKAATTGRIVYPPDRCLAHFVRGNPEAHVRGTCCTHARCGDAGARCATKPTPVTAHTALLECCAPAHTPVLSSLGSLRAQRSAARHAPPAPRPPRSLSPRSETFAPLPPQNARHSCLQCAVVKLGARARPGARPARRMGGRERARKAGVGQAMSGLIVHPRTLFPVQTISVPMVYM